MLAVMLDNPILAEKRSLAAEIDGYCTARGIKATTFGRMVGQGSDFYARLLDDRFDHRWATLQKVRAFIVENPVETGDAA
jgi:hypothetical protein